MSAILSALLSTLCFAFMSFYVKKAILLDVTSVDMVFYRFIIGSVFFILYFIFTKKLPRIVSWKFTLLRAATNIIAVSFFYITIGLLDLGSANLLNLTYPIFISVLAPLLLKENTSKKQSLAIVLSSIGVTILFYGKTKGVYLEGLIYGLICGFTSAITIMSLRQARKFDQSISIVSVLMFCGTLCLLPFYSFHLPSNGDAYLPILLACVFAVAGQLFITFSFKKLSALQGSIISSSRILFSFLLGILFLGDRFEIRFIVSLILVSIAIHLSKATSPEKT